MTIRLIPIALASVALLGLATPAHAGKGKDRTARVLAHFDKDHNGVLEGKEVDRVRAVYAALYALDTNHDGQLSDSEIAAAKISPGGKGKKKNAQ